MKKILLRIITIVAGLLIALALIELCLRVAGLVITEKKGEVIRNSTRTTMLFAGDSWTYGSDAKRGNGFVDLLKRDSELSNFEFYNVGFGGTNCMEAVNSVIDFEGKADVVFIMCGFNSWHLLGRKQFVNSARQYLFREEFKKLSQDLEWDGTANQLEKFKIYRLWRQLSSRLVRHGEGEEVNLEVMNKEISDDNFWEQFISYRERYPNHPEQKNQIPYFLKTDHGMSLDQIFYFTANNLGFASPAMEDALKKAGHFRPEKLKIFPYEVYKKMGGVPR